MGVRVKDAFVSDETEDHYWYIEVFSYSNWQHYSKKIYVSPLVALYFIRAGMAVLDKLSVHLQTKMEGYRGLTLNQRDAVIVYNMFLLLQPYSIKEYGH